jgi:hypothetical protein
MGPSAGGWLQGWREWATERIMAHFPSREENRADATRLKCFFVLPSAAEGVITLPSHRVWNNGLCPAPGKWDMFLSRLLTPPGEYDTMKDRRGGGEKFIAWRSKFILAKGAVAALAFDKWHSLLCRMSFLSPVGGGRTTSFRWIDFFTKYYTHFTNGMGLLYSLCNWFQNVSALVI